MRILKISKKDRKVDIVQTSALHIKKDEYYLISFGLKSKLISLINFFKTVVFPKTLTHMFYPPVNSIKRYNCLLSNSYYVIFLHNEILLI